MTGRFAELTHDRGHRWLVLLALRVMFVLSVSFVTACGRMTVQVDVVDPAYVDTVTQQAELQAQLCEAFRPPNEKNQKYAVIRRDLVTGLRDAEQTPEEIQANLNEFDDLTGDLRALDQQIRSAVAEQPHGPDVTVPRLNYLLLQGQAIEEAAVDNVLKLLKEIATVSQDESLPGSTEVPTESESTPLSPEARVALKSLTGGRTLTESTYAYAVALARPAPLMKKRRTGLSRCPSWRRWLAVLKPIARASRARGFFENPWLA